MVESIITILSLMMHDGVELLIESFIPYLENVSEVVFLAIILHEFQDTEIKFFFGFLKHLIAYNLLPAEDNKIIFFKKEF